MSEFPANDPVCASPTSGSPIETIIESRPRDLGGFSVRRFLPSRARRTIGPYVFFDHMGPATFPVGQGIDVRPHPHINLATVTYLFEGEIIHRDSLGSHQAIRPGAINWMTAGRGIVHSERTGAEQRRQGARLHGIQIWVALPKQAEESEPEFSHHPAERFPLVQRDGASLRVLIGSAFGRQSPVKIFSPMVYVDVSLTAGARLALPSDHPERAVYLVDGALACAETEIQAPRMTIFKAGSLVELQALTDARLLFLAGEPLDGERFLWWNFVSSSRDRIDRAKRDWSQGRFPKVPGDEDEFIPLPESS